MARPLRIELPGALYHVSSQGDRRETIFAHDEDRLTFLQVLQIGLQRFDAAVLAYCLMGNHYQLVLQTRQANLSKLMRHVNGVYTQRFNRRHAKTGHVFQGRFKALVMDRDRYLLRACSSVDAHPVRAGQVRAPEHWAWSSYRAHVGLTPAPGWLDTAQVWHQALGHHVQGAVGRQRAMQAYRHLVHGAHGAEPWTQQVRQQLYLGDEDFVRRLHAECPAGDAAPQAHPDAGRTLDEWLDACESREEAFARAYRSSRWTMTRIAAAAGLSVQQVSRLIARFEGRVGSHAATA